MAIDGWRAPLRVLIAGAGVLGVIMIATFLTLVRTPWGHRLDLAAYYAPIADKTQLGHRESATLDYLTPISMLIMLTVLVAVAFVIGNGRVGLIAAAFVCGAWVSAEVLKRIQVWEPLIDGDFTLPPGLQTGTFPSGHTTASTSLALAIVMIAPRGTRVWVGFAAGCVSALVGISVLISGWHRPSDAIGGSCWAGIVMATGILACFVLRQVRTQDPVSWSRNQIISGIVTAAMLTAAVFLLVVVQPVPDRADIALVLLVAAIASCGLAVGCWFGSVTGALEWRKRGEIGVSS